MAQPHRCRFYFAGMFPFSQNVRDDNIQFYFGKGLLFILPTLNRDFHIMCVSRRSWKALQWGPSVRYLTERPVNMSASSRTTAWRSSQQFPMLSLFFYNVSKYPTSCTSLCTSAPKWRIHIFRQHPTFNGKMVKLMGLSKLDNHHIAATVRQSTLRCKPVVRAIIQGHIS